MSIYEFVCKDCGSKDVLYNHMASFDPNNKGAFIEEVGEGGVDEWCNNCENDCMIVNKNEYVPKLKISDLKKGDTVRVRDDCLEVGESVGLNFVVDSLVDDVEGGCAVYVNVKGDVYEYPIYCLEIIKSRKENDQ